MRCSTESWEAEEKCQWDSHLSCVPITWMCGAIKPEPRSCPCPAPGSDSPCTATAAKEGWGKLTKVVAGGNGTVIRFGFFTLKRFMKVSGTGIVQMSHEKGIATAICAHVLEHKPQGRACIRKHPGWRKCYKESSSGKRDRDMARGIQGDNLHQWPRPLHLIFPRCWRRAAGKPGCSREASNFWHPPHCSKMPRAQPLIQSHPKTLELSLT